MTETMRRVGIIGAGNMGTALAHLLANNGADVVLWDHFSEVVEEINAVHTNSRYLPHITLPPSVRAVRDRAACVRDADLIVLAVPSPFVRAAMNGLAPHFRRKAFVLNTVKGIDPESHRPIFESIQNEIPDHHHCLLAGPAIANEFSRGGTTAVVIASGNPDAAEEAASHLESETFRVATTDDVTGAALGGLLKNCYALLFGYLDAAVNVGRNFEAALLTAATREMADLGEALGGRRDTFFGLAGIGDLAATAFSRDSHNRKCGRLLGTGMTLAEVRKAMSVLPEGVRTVTPVVAWAKEHRVPLPIGTFAKKIIAGGKVEISHLIQALA